ncbi:hypothetical protein C8J57DRAFT_224319 [Mycena rebaudengoi]|nr:hypothetical protein C8J57DRAFT_224319 [Mycena rebaudengoi]
MMFQPFEAANQFYPGLILWCDPHSHEMDLSTHPPNTPYNRRTATELRPCLVVSVDYQRHRFQVARFSATTPTDTTKWVKIDSPPAITWKLNDAWIWVGTPAVVPMILNNAKAMHPNRDEYYSVPPVSSTNLQNYWIHRQQYINRRMMAGAVSNDTSTYQGNTFIPSTSSSARYPTAMQGNFFSQDGTSTQVQHPSQFYQPGPQPTEFTTLASQPVVVPTGFTETNPSNPGWWRNPQTGWFWHASLGLLPPASAR